MDSFYTIILSTPSQVFPTYANLTQIWDSLFAYRCTIGYAFLKWLVIPHCRQLGQKSNSDRRLNEFIFVLLIYTKAKCSPGPSCFEALLRSTGKRLEVMCKFFSVRRGGGRTLL